ncbi:MAG: cytochrome c-type biogenesis protein CcmH [Magnetococcales bacterium]|nr:cytochrome c-type biogenesis protein CcmH [Magnetococcales bacterium]
MKNRLLLMLLAVCVGMLWFAPAAFSVARDEDPTEALVRKIAKDLRCAVCQNQSVYESNADLAKDMLLIIRDKVRAGEDEAKIRDYFFQRYGDYIYLKPTGEGKNKILWLAPFLGLLIGVAGLWTAISRWRRPRTDTAENAATPLTPEVRERIQKELDQIQV